MPVGNVRKARPLTKPLTKQLIKPLTKQLTKPLTKPLTKFLSFDNVMTDEQYELKEVTCEQAVRVSA